MQPKRPRYGRRLCSLLSRKALFPGRQSSSRWRPGGWELSGEQAGGGHQPPPCVLRAERHFPVGASLPRALLSFAVLSPALQSRLALESERDSCLVGAGLGSASVVSVPAEEAPCLGTLVVPAERNGKPLHLSSLPLALNFEASEEPQGCVATRTGPQNSPLTRSSQLRRGTWEIREVIYAELEGKVWAGVGVPTITSDQSSCRSGDESQPLGTLTCASLI